MFKTDENEFFESVLFHSLGISTAINRLNFISGGYGNNVVKIETSEGNFCIKWHETLPKEAFEAQYKDLTYLNKLVAVRFPNALSAGILNQKAYLLMEDIGFHLPDKNFFSVLGEQLALLHANKHKSFGWAYPNWLHGFEQKNNFTSNWSDFYFEHRLKPLFGKAFFEGKIDQSILRKLDTLQEKTFQLFSKESPSLLHGNLHRDNMIAGHEGQPVLQSPSPYFGNRELELVSVLFLNDIPEEFLETYQATFPLQEGFEERKPLYQLFVLGQYLNQFGASYLGGIEKIFKLFLT